MRARGGRALVFVLLSDSDTWVAHLIGEIYRELRLRLG